MPYFVTVPPAVEPVSVAQAKAHLRIDFPDDDDLIADAITTARQWVELGLRRALINQTLQAVIDLPPPIQGRLSGVIGRPGFGLDLPQTAMGTLQSVSLAEIETQIATWSSLVVTNDYLVDSMSEPCRIYLAASAIAQWSVSLNYPGSVPRVRITYVAGYGATAASVPAPIRRCILNVTGHLYENRESGGEIPETLLPFEYVVMRL